MVTTLYALDFYLKASDKAMLEEVMTRIPAADDSPNSYQKNGPYYSPAQGCYVAQASIRFKSQADRDSYYNEITNIAGVLDGCLPGSHVRKHDCFNDEGKPCQLEILYMVVVE